jgi:hypothetical protein
MEKCLVHFLYSAMKHSPALQAGEIKRQPMPNLDAIIPFKAKNLKFTFVLGYAIVLCCF